MILKVFSIYDSRTGAFAAPFCTHTPGSAERLVRSALDSKESDLSKYPEDYTLFELGSWDDSTGVVTSLETPHSLGVLVQFKGQ